MSQIQVSSNFVGYAVTSPVYFPSQPRPSKLYTNKRVFVKKAEIMKAILFVCLVVLLCEKVLAARRQGSHLTELKMRSRGSQTLVLSMEEAKHMVRLECMSLPTVTSVYSG